MISYSWVWRRGWQKSISDKWTGAMRLRYLLIATSALMVAAAAPANATTYDISFTAGPFNHLSGSGPAVSSVSGEFLVTLDTSSTYSDGTTVGISAVTLPVALGSTLSFEYPVTTGGFDHALFIGGTSDGTGGVYYDTNDFYFHINNFSTTPTFQQFGFTTYTAAGGDYYYTNQGDGTVTVTEVSATPLPPALPLFVSALAGFGLIGWWHQKNRRTQLPATAA